MKVSVLAFLLAFLCVGTAIAAPKERVAPADEYFGRLKMSILGIANTIKDQSLKFDSRPDLVDSEMGSVKLAVDAIRDWQRKYPHDPWIAKTLFLLERFYNRIPTDEGRAKAKATMAWLVRDFPNTWYGRTGKRELAEGKVGVAVAQPVLGEAVPVPASSPQ